MTHEPECNNAKGQCCPWLPTTCNCQCTCDTLRLAYQRGYADGSKS